MKRNDSHRILSKMTREHNNPYLALQLAHKSAPKQYKEKQTREQPIKGITAEVFSHVPVYTDNKRSNYANKEVEQTNHFINSKRRTKNG